MHFRKFIFPILAMFVLSNCAKLKTISLQGKDFSKDGHAWSARPNDIRGHFYFFDARAWTWNGQGDGPGVTRSFINFNLSGLPGKSRIINAKLFLYQNKTSENKDAKHSTLSGSNECVLQRIISPWSDEDISWAKQPKTTTEHQVMIPASISPIQDYAIDITPLIVDIIKEKETSYGLMLRLVNEEAYRAVVFCSTDSDDPSLYPKLVITYR